MPSKAEYWRNPEKYRAATRAYAVANPEWKKESNREWLKSPQGKTFIKTYRRKEREGWTEEQRAARGAYQKEWFANNPDYNKQKLAEYKAKRPQRNMVWAAKTRAAKLGVPFDLDWQKIEIPDLCPALGVPMRPALRGEPRRASPSLDRLIPALGYVQSNVRVISAEANIIKHDKSLEEMRAYVLRLRKQLEGAEAVLAYLERELC